MEIEQRRAKVAELYLQGRYQWEIAEVIGVTQATVSMDLKAIQERWKASAVRDLDAAKARELERIDQLERTYWQAWERSQKDAESTTTRTEEAGEAPKEGEGSSAPSLDAPPKLMPVKRTTEKSAKGQAGDPRFLDGVLSCIKRRCDLLGLDAPKELMTPPGKSFVLTVLGPGQKMEDL